MTSKQKQKKLDNLAKAREAKAKKNPPAYSQFAKEVVALPDDHEFSLKNVREWIKEAKTHKAAEHRNHLAGNSGALARKEMWAGYINQLESYLRSGAYVSAFAGGDMSKRVKRYCVSMAYYPDGRPKRELGVWYKDYMQVWTPELENQERQAYGLEPLEFNDKGYIVVDRPVVSKGNTKKRKKREMTPEQKQALVERLRKAREAKAAKKNS